MSGPAALVAAVLVYIGLAAQPEGTRGDHRVLPGLASLRELVSVHVVRRLTRPATMTVSALAAMALLLGLVSIGPGTSQAAADQDRDAIVEQLSPEHPRLLATDEDFADLRSRVESDPTSAHWHELLRQDGERILTEPPSEYEIPDGIRLLATSQLVLHRVETLALLYQVDGDARWAERAWDELEAAAGFPDWNPRHFLDTATMTEAFAIGYDWLYHYLSPERREVVREAIVTMGLTPAQAAYRGDGSTDAAIWWVNSNSNWNVVCNGGIGLGALAIGDEVPELAEEILQGALDSLPTALASYAPDGAYPEGVGYWEYATMYLVRFAASLETAVGDDFGLSDSPGLSTTGDFPIYLTGPTGQNFNYYDSDTGSRRPPEMFWLANAYDQPAYAWWGRQGAEANADPRHLLWYDPDNVAGPREAGLPLDRYFRTSEVATFRSAWEDPNAVFTGFKAGDNTSPHSDTDLGTFVLDALGTRWATELGSDDYNMPGYTNDPGPEGQRWTYYRKRAEGQNTLVVNPGEGADQDPLASGEIVRQESGAGEAFAIAELTDAYTEHGVTSWRRGVSQFDHRRQVLVQDELTADEPVDAWWFMHTRADVEVGADGRTATLSDGDERLVARILSPAEDATFVAMDAAPLWTSPDPDGQAANSGLQKLAIQLDGVEDMRLSVLLTPLRDGQEPDEDLPDVEPLADWTVPDTQPAQLSGIRIGGVPLETFSPGTFTYDVEVPEGSAPPTVEATADAGARVIVQQPRSLPGTARIRVIDRDGPRSLYEVHFDEPSPTHVIASADDGNAPENTIDNDLGTRWSAQGDGHWIRYDLGEPTSVQSVAIAWHQGDTRSAFFDIEVSDDGENWTQVFSGSSSGETTELEEYLIEQDATARYVRVVGHGTSASARNGITELRVRHPSGEWPEFEVPPPYLAELRLSAEPDELVLGETGQLDLTGVLSDGTEVSLENETITYVSGNEQVAQVDPAGVVEGIGEGTAQLSAIVTTDDRRLLHDRLTMAVDDPSTVTLQPIADTFVNDGAYADTNFNDRTELAVKKVPVADSGVGREAFLAFDLADVEGPIESATLHVSAAVRDHGGTEIDLHFHTVGDNWEESTLTWNNRPAPGEPIATTHVDDVYQWRTVDVTAYAADQLTGDGRMSLAVLQDPPDDGYGFNTLIRSRENAGFSPYLVVKLAQQQ